MVHQQTIVLPKHRRGFHLVTDTIFAQLKNLPQTGIFHAFIKHTSAALSINENADPTVRQDLTQAFDRLAPEVENYRHDAEGPDDMPAHIKNVLIGSSISIPISQGQLNLGTWQGIYLCEFRDHATPRTIVVTVMS